MAYDLRFHPKVKADLRRIPRPVRRRIEAAIDERLTTEPERFGIPLQATLRAYRKLRVGDHRVVFRIDESVVRILVIAHRREVYERAERRLK